MVTVLIRRTISYVVVPRLYLGEMQTLHPICALATNVVNLGTLTLLAGSLVLVPQVLCIMLVGLLYLATRLCEICPTLFFTHQPSPQYPLKNRLK